MLKIIKVSENIINQAKIAFNSNKSNESLIARYEIFRESNQKIKTDNNGKPIFKNGLFWSISHKKNLVFVGTSSTEIGIDIEIIKPRGEEIFSLHKKEEYELFGGKNEINFYRLWTIKEAVIKLNLSGIDYLDKIKISKIIKKTNIFDNIKFDLEIYGKFENKDFICYNGIDGELVYSMSYFL